MASTFSYRPKNYSVDQLKQIAKKHRQNLNRYIEEAVVEKIRQERVESSSLEKLAKKITKVVAEHMELPLEKPDPARHHKINRKFEETTRKGRWIPDSQARPGR